MCEHPNFQTETLRFCLKCGFSLSLCLVFLVLILPYIFPLLCT